MRRLALPSFVLLGACGGGGPAAPDASTLRPWSAEEPPSSVLGGHRGLQPARGIIHLHSPYSHDACDGNPRGDTGLGPIDETCYGDLRAGLCATRQDFAALTDHDDSMADEEFATLFLERGTDAMVGAGASRIHCDNGHDVLLSVGGENDLMPIMLHQHVPGDAAARHATYNGFDQAAVDAFRAAGALVWVPHTEQDTPEVLAPLRPDGVEVYQLHANLDPDIRPILGLDPNTIFNMLAPFIDTLPGGPEPDLAFLAFVEPNPPALATWDALLGQGLHVAGSGGTDAHQNVLSLEARDGERLDSYRRMMRWFSNVALVADPTDPIQIEDALRAGRMYVAFEVLGTPVGFDAHAGDVELGGTVAATDGATLEVTLPTVYDLDPTQPAPVIAARVLRVTAGASTVVAEGGGPTLSVPLDTAGAYRVEVTIQPLHEGAYLGSLGTADAERVLTWIYASPIYVE